MVMLSRSWFSLFLLVGSVWVCKVNSVSSTPDTIHSIVNETDAVVSTSASSVPNENEASRIKLRDTILSWEFPSEIREKFPYYLLGYDNEGHPVFMVEFGKWDIRSYVESDDNHTVLFDKYMEQLTVRFTNPELVEPAHKEDAPPDKFIIIADLDSYSVRQVAHPRSLQAYLSGMKKFVNNLRLRRINVKKGFFINSNFVFQSVWNLLRPIFGETLVFMELYGPKSSRWKPILLQHIEKDQLPEFLGGSRENYKPLQAYG